jgi:hypothetical protein
MLSLGVVFKWIIFIFRNFSGGIGLESFKCEVSFIGTPADLWWPNILAYSIVIANFRFPSKKQGSAQRDWWDPTK